MATISTTHILTKHGHETRTAVKVVSALNDGFRFVVIEDTDDGNSVVVYEDEIDNLIEALTNLKGELK